MHGFVVSKPTKKGENYHYPRKLSDGTPGSIMPGTTILGKKCYLPARDPLRGTD